MFRHLNTSAVLALCLLCGPVPLPAAEDSGESLVPSLLAGRGALDEFDTLALLPASEDGDPRLILGDIHGFLHVFEQRDESFEEVWISSYLESAISGLIVVDIDNDSFEEIVVFTSNGRFHYLDLDAYNTIWSNPPHEYDRITALSIYNIDEDPQPELVFCADGYLIIYDGRDHFEEWRSDQSNLETTDILVADVDGDGSDEIVLNDGYVFDARFHDLEWQSPDSFGQRMGLLDLDNDGIPELIGEFGGRFIRIFDIDLRREKSTRP